LTHRTELRTKYVPSEEVLFDDVAWEVGYGVRYGTAQKGLILIKPRHGKHTVQQTVAQKMLRSVVTTHKVLAMSRNGAIKAVIHKIEGPFSKLQDVVQDSLILDSGLRMAGSGGYPVPAKFQDPVEAEHEEMRRPPKRAQPRPLGLVSSSNGTPPPAPDFQVSQHMPSSRRSFVVDPIVGSKLVLMKRTPNGNMTLYTIKERAEKNFDFVGGTSNPGETAEQTLVREVGEETHVRFPPKTFFYLGDSIPADGSAVAHVYLGLEEQFPDGALDSLGYKRVSVKGNSVVQGDTAWIERITQFVVDQCGNWEGAWWVANAHCMRFTNREAVDLRDDTTVVRAAKAIFRSTIAVMQQTGKIETPNMQHRTILASSDPLAPTKVDVPRASLLASTPLPTRPAPLAPPFPTGTPSRVSEVVIDVTRKDLVEFITKHPDEFYYVVAKYVINHGQMGVPPTASETYRYLRKLAPGIDPAPLIDVFVKRGWINKTATTGGHSVFTIPAVFH